MKLENQVPSLELCKKLKELGYSQKGLFYWYVEEGKTFISVEELDLEECYVAPTVAEMGEWLDGTRSGMYGEEARCIHFKHGDGHSEYDKTEANARAKMLIWLVENDYIDFKEKK